MSYSPPSFVRPPQVTHRLCNALFIFNEGKAGIALPPGPKPTPGEAQRHIPLRALSRTHRVEIAVCLRNWSPYKHRASGFWHFPNLREAVNECVTARFVDRTYFFRVVSGFLNATVALSALVGTFRSRDNSSISPVLATGTPDHERAAIPPSRSSSSSSTARQQLLLRLQLAECSAVEPIEPDICVRKVVNDNHFSFSTKVDDA